MAFSICSAVSTSWAPWLNSAVCPIAGLHGIVACVEPLGTTCAWCTCLGTAPCARPTSLGCSGDPEQSCCPGKQPQIALTHAYVSMGVESVSAARLMWTAASTRESTSHSAPHCGSTILRHRLPGKCLSTLVELNYCLHLSLTIGSATTTTGFLRQTP